jgi:hypothetical protein
MCMNLLGFFIIALNVYVLTSSQAERGSATLRKCAKFEVPHKL